MISIAVTQAGLGMRRWMGPAVAEPFRPSFARKRIALSTRTPPARTKKRSPLRGQPRSADPLHQTRRAERQLDYSLQAIRPKSLNGIRGFLVFPHPGSSKLPQGSNPMISMVYYSLIKGSIAAVISGRISQILLMSFKAIQR